jgi:hypothetical protein
MRSALFHLLVGEMEARFAPRQAQAARDPCIEPTSEAEFTALVDKEGGDAVPPLSA